MPDPSHTGATPPESGKKRQPFTWNGPKETAAMLLAEDERTDAEIAERVGIAIRTLRYWKENPSFKARVAEHVQAIGAAACRLAIGRRMRRVRALDERWQALQRVISERAADPDIAHVPGGKTGLLVRTMKSIGSGPGAQVVNEYAVDTGLLKTLLDHEKQAAQELGQWAEKHEHTGQDGGPIQNAVVILPYKDTDADIDTTTADPGPADRAAAGTATLPEKSG